MTQLMTPAPLDLPDELLLRLAPEAVPCGFPSAAQDYYAGELDLKQHLVRDEASTYVWRASGHSMTGDKISDGDLLLVDRGVRAVPGRIVVAVVDAEYTVKRLEMVGGKAVLRAANPDYPDIVPSEFSTLEVWGVVTWVLHPTGAA